MISRTKRAPGRRHQRGSALVELALCLLAFILLTFGAMDFGYAVFAYDFCSMAAQDAARWASVRGSQSSDTGAPATQDNITTFVKAEAIGLDQSLVTVTATWNPDNKPGSNVTVTVAYTVKPLSGLAIKQNLTVSSTAQVMVNN